MGKHAEWRKLAKKLRRKRIRSMIAVARDQQLLQEKEKRERSPTYKAWLEEQTILEEFKAAEEKRLSMERQKLWAAQEEAALMRWREQQSRMAHAKAEKFKKEMLIREEWEREQRKIQEAEEARKKTEDEKKRKQAELLAQIDAFIEGRAELPEEVNVSTQTQPDHPECPFFLKTGACRFRDSCSRNHTRPGISRTLLVPNFYDHFGLTTLHHDEYDTDQSLEYEDSETYQHFKEFYNDVLPEFEQFGRLTQFKVCNNEEPHLRGNVYVEFQSRRHALKAYRTFQGRFYAGRRLNVEFTNIPSWKNAVCGLFHRQKCPKGKTCNFLHVFRNPNNAFKIQDGHSSSRRQFSRSRSKSPRRRSRSKSKEWHWSDGSDSESDKKRSRSRSRSRLCSKNYDSGSDNGRSRSKSPAKNKTQSRHRSKSYERDRKKKNKKDRKRDEKYRSTSRSPRRHEKKRHRDDDRDDQYKRSRKDKYDKETNGRDYNLKYNKKTKDDSNKRGSRESSDRGESTKKYKDKYDETEKSYMKYKKRSIEEYQSTSKPSSSVNFNGREQIAEKYDNQTKRYVKSYL